MIDFELWEGELSISEPNSYNQKEVLLIYWKDSDNLSVAVTGKDWEITQQTDSKGISYINIGKKFV